MSTLIPKHLRKSPVNRFSFNERKQIYNVPKTGVKSVDDRAENRTKLKTPYLVYKQKRTRVGAASPEALKEALKERLHKLKKAGYYTGKIDGIWGKKSEAALAAYDRDNKQNSNMTVGQKYRRAAGRPEPKEFVVSEVPDHNVYEVITDESGNVKTRTRNKTKIERISNGMYNALDMLLKPFSAERQLLLTYINPPINLEQDNRQVEYTDDGMSEKGYKSQQGNAIYLDYPSYKGNAATGYPGSEAVAAVVGKDAKMPVGHNAFILVDDNGNTEFYEYGRYNQGQTHGSNILGVYKPNEGNWVRRRIPNRGKDETLDQYMARLRESGTLPHNDLGTVHATFINGVNLPEVRNYVMSQASDKDRAKYSLANTCATQAALALNSGFNLGNYAKGLVNFGTHQLNPRSLLNEAKSIIQSKGWRLVPGSSQAIGQGMSNLGTTKTY